MQSRVDKIGKLSTDLKSPLNSESNDTNFIFITMTCHSASSNKEGQHLYTSPKNSNVGLAPKRRVYNFKCWLGACLPPKVGQVHSKVGLAPKIRKLEGKLKNWPGANKFKCWSQICWHKFPLSTIVGALKPSCTYYSRIDFSGDDACFAKGTPHLSTRRESERIVYTT